MTKKLVRIPRLNPELLIPYSQLEAGVNIEVISLMVFSKNPAESSKLNGIKGRHPCFRSLAGIVFTDFRPSFQEQHFSQGLPIINQGAIEYISHAHHLEHFSKKGNNIIKPRQLNQNKWILKMTFKVGPSKPTEC